MIKSTMKIAEMHPAFRQGDTRGPGQSHLAWWKIAKKIIKNSWKIYPLPGRAFKIGITGAPGSGKSSLIDKMIAGLKTRG